MLVGRTCLAMLVSVSEVASVGCESQRAKLGACSMLLLLQGPRDSFDAAVTRDQDRSGDLSDKVGVRIGSNVNRYMYVKSSDRNSLLPSASKNMIGNPIGELAEHHAESNKSKQNRSGRISPHRKKPE